MAPDGTKQFSEVVDAQAAQKRAQLKVDQLTGQMAALEAELKAATHRGDQVGGQRMDGGREGGGEGEWRHGG